MTRSCRLAGAALAALAWAGAPPGLAAEPAAIVEDVQGPVKDVQPFDYVAAGTRIELPGRAILVLGYLKSCARETITGGKVTIGDDQSTVQGGEVKRERVECDGGRMQLTTAQASKSGVMVFRGASKPAATPQPQVTIYGVSPIFTGDAAERLEIKRLDTSGQAPLDFPLAKPKAGRGLAFDLAKQNVALAPGGLYQATSGGHTVVFRVDPQAKPG
ncbi:MAG: hypothetical protein HY060_18665, partial [Proteobacteria bacterium]|nr:hypothetical protein [Pseudomonadota bacterium]